MGRGATGAGLGPAPRASVERVRQPEVDSDFLLLPPHREGDRSQSGSLRAGDAPGHLVPGRVLPLATGDPHLPRPPHPRAQNQSGEAQDAGLRGTGLLPVGGLRRELSVAASLPSADRGDAPSARRDRRPGDSALPDVFCRQAGRRGGSDGHRDLPGRTASLRALLEPQLPNPQPRRGSAALGTDGLARGAAARRPDRDPFASPSMSDVHERLRRLLFLVPYVSKHPGVSVEELAKALSLPTDSLLKELDLLTMIGRPPFQPDDYIDIYVENGRVYVDLDQRFSAPPRLTAAEAAALSAAAEFLRPASGGSLGTALSKLERVVPESARAQYRDMERKIDANVQGPTDLAPLSKAISDRREVTFEYFSQGRGTVEQRRGRPLELFTHRGQWYLHAYCCTRHDERLFRLDRIRNLAVTDTVFAVSAAARPTMPNPASAEGQVRVRFSPTAAPYVRERFGSDVRALAGGGAEVNVAGDSERWLTQWILSFGGEAEVVEPAWAREAIARAARGGLSN